MRGILLLLVAWGTVALSVLAALLSTRNARLIRNGRRVLRYLQGAVLLGLALVYTLGLMRVISPRQWFDLVLPGYLSLIAVTAARELISTAFGGDK